MISTNGGCDLPCWLSLIPGEATQLDIDKLYLPIRGTFRPHPTTVETIMMMADLDLNGDNFPELSIKQFEQYGTIQRILVSTGSFNRPENDPLYYPPLTEAMQQYALAQVLAQYGVPTRVWIGLSGGPAEPGGSWIYSMWVFYDNLGFSVYYEGALLSRTADTLRVCPTYEGVSNITMYLQSAESERSLDVYLEDEYGSWVQGMFSQGILMDLESATGLSTEEFHRRFTEPGQEPCIEPPAELWH